MYSDIISEPSDSFQVGKIKSQSFFVEFLIDNFFVKPSNHSPPVSLFNPTLHLAGLNTLVPLLAQQVGNLCHELSLVPERCVQIGPSFKIITKPLKIVASLAYLTHLVVFENTGIEIGPSLFDKWFGFCVGKHGEVLSKNWLIAQVYVRKLVKAETVLYRILKALSKNSVDRSLMRIENEHALFCSPNLRSSLERNFLFASFQAAFSSLCSFGSAISFSFEKSLELFESSFLDSKIMLRDLQQTVFGVTKLDELVGSNFFIENLFTCTSAELNGVCFFLSLRRRCTNLFNTAYWSSEAVINSADVMSMLYHDVLTYFCCYSIRKKRSLVLLDAVFFFLFGKSSISYDNTLNNNQSELKEASKHARRSYLSKVVVKSCTTVSHSLPICGVTETHVRRDVASPLKFYKCDFRCFNDTHTLNSAVELLSSMYDVSAINDKTNVSDNNDILDGVLKKNTAIDFPLNGVELAIPTTIDDDDIDFYLRNYSEFDKMNRVHYAMSE